MSENIQRKRINKNRQRHNGEINGWRLAFIIILVTIIIGIGIGTGMAYSYIKDAPPLNMENFQYIEPSAILDVNDEFYQEFQGKEKRKNVSIEKIPDIVQKAFISIEDERFYDHAGVDIMGIGQAALQGIKAGDLTAAGGSTITQQLIKLTHLSSEKSLKRKVQEAYLAIQLEKNMTKDQILESYLNKINFAYAHGIQAASETYFGKDVRELTIAQAAVLAAIPKAPTTYKPYVIEEKKDDSFGIAYEKDGKTLAYSSKNRDRALTVLGKMKELEYISEDQYLQAKNQIESNKIGLVKPKDDSIYSYFTDAVYEQVLNDLKEKYHYTTEEATSYLINGGLTIYSTVNPKIQSAMDENFKKNNLFPSQSSSAKQVNYTPEGAMVIIDNTTGYVSGIVGGRNKEKSRSLNRALKTFQIGSSTKPLTVYAPGIDSKKITLATTYDDIPIRVGGETPGNAGAHRGMTTIRKGLTNSINTIAVQAWYDIGIETSLEYGEKFGLEFAKEGEPNDMGYGSLALGGYTKGQTPLAMASAFSAFPNQGVRVEPTFYTKVVDPSGNIILKNKPKKTQVISAQTAFLITDVLKNVVKGGTTTISVPRIEIAGKTGTTNNQKDAWFVGYTPKYTASVWYGYDDNKVVANGREYFLNIGVYGGSKPGPAVMWESVMRDIYKDKGSQTFPANPGGIVSANVDSVSGLLPTELSYRDPRGSTIISEMFINGTVPTSKDNYHVELKVDTSTNKLATEYCPPELVKSRVFIKKPADRFPSPVKPIDSNYVANGEKNAFIPAGTCDIHNKNGSIFQLQIVIPKDTIQIGEEVQLGVKGNTKDGLPIKITNVEFSTDSDAIQIMDKNTGIIRGLKEGSANIIAKVSFRYQDHDYVDVATGTISIKKENIVEDIINDIIDNDDKENDDTKNNGNPQNQDEGTDKRDDNTSKEKDKKKDNPAEPLQLILQLKNNPLANMRKLHH